MMTQLLLYIAGVKRTYYREMSSLWNISTNSVPVLRRKKVSQFQDKFNVVEYGISYIVKSKIPNE